MKKMIIMLSAPLALISNLALADVTAEVMAGRRWVDRSTGDKDTSGAQANDVVATAHWAPFANVPVSFGPALTYSQYREQDWSADDVSELSVGLETKAWYDLGSGLKPYGRLRYVAYSQGEIKGSTDVLGNKVDYNSDFKTNGFHAAAGINYAVTEQISVLAEGSYGVQMFQTTKTDFKNVTPGLVATDSEEKGPSRAFNSKSLLVGMNVNF